jgi:hypothetical protein
VKKFFPIIIVSFWLMAGCASESSRSNALINVFLVDAPGDYDEVLVEVLGVEVVGDEGSADFPFIQADRRVNLTQLIGGERVMIGRGEFPAGNLTQIRLKLGNAHSLVQRGVRADLRQRGSDTDPVIDVDMEIIGGLSYDLYIDFDVQRSVRLIPTSGGNTFELVPRLRAFTRDQTGDIAGTILPQGSGRSVVYALQGFDTVATTSTTASGRFVLNGIFGETRISVVPFNRDLRDTIFSKSVLPRRTVQVGNINLQPRR